MLVFLVWGRLARKDVFSEIVAGEFSEVDFDGREDGEERFP